MSAPKTPPTLPKVSPFRFDNMPPLKEGHCNWCGCELPEGREKFCSKGCSKTWSNAMMTFGAACFERLLVQRTLRHTKPLPEVAKRARREAENIADDFRARLRLMQERERNQ